MKQAPQKITITSWYEAQNPGFTATFNIIDKQFEKMHPGVTVDAVGKATSTLAAQAPLAMQTGSGPDIIEAWDTGYDVLGRMVKAGSLTPLNSYAKQYGWLSRSSSSFFAQCTYTPDGSTWGTGNLYALPFQGGAIGLYYNKAKLASLGVGVPKTLAQFLSDVQLAKQHGLVPIMLGNAQGFPLLQIFEPIDASLQPTLTSMRDWIFGIGHGKATFVTPANLKAAQIVATLGSNGDLNSDYAGVQLLDMVDRFAKGEGVFMVSGTWFAADVGQIMGSNGGFVPFPGPPVANGNPTPFGISAKSKYQALDAEYLNFITDPASLQVYVKQGGFPPGPMSPSAAGAKPGSTSADAFLMYDVIQKSDGFIAPYNAATTSELQTEDASLEELIAGKLTPAGFLQAVQADYTSYWSSQG
jgi:raffinose/stachyose/melibiose transport system substrate-binding protein